MSSPKALCPVLRHLAFFAGRHMGVWTDEAGWTWSRVWLRFHCPELHPGKHTVLACRLVGRTGGLRSRWDEKLSFSLFFWADKSTGVNCRDKIPDLLVLFSFFVCVFCLFSPLNTSHATFYFHEILGASHLGSPRGQWCTGTKKNSALFVWLLHLSVGPEGIIPAFLVCSGVWILHFWSDN